MWNIIFYRHMHIVGYNSSLKKGSIAEPVTEHSLQH